MLLMEVLRTWGFGVGLGISTVMLALFIIRKKIPRVAIYFCFILVPLIYFSYVTTLYYDQRLSFLIVLLAFFFPPIVILFNIIFSTMFLGREVYLKCPENIKKANKIGGYFIIILFFSFGCFPTLAVTVFRHYPTTALFSLFIGWQIITWLILVILSIRILARETTRLTVEILPRKQFLEGILLTLVLGTAFEAFRGLWLIWGHTAVWFILICVSLRNIMRYLNILTQPSNSLDSVSKESLVDLGDLLFLAPFLFFIFYLVFRYSLLAFLFLLTPLISLVLAALGLHINFVPYIGKLFEGVSIIFAFIACRMVWKTLFKGK